MVVGRDLEGKGMGSYCLMGTGFHYEKVGSTLKKAETGICIHKTRDA